MSRRPPSALVEDLLDRAHDQNDRLLDGILFDLDSARLEEVARELDRMFDERLTACWERGWQPADLLPLIDRDLSHREGNVLRLAVGAQAVGYQQWGRAVAPRWMAQLDEFEVSVGPVSDGAWPLRSGMALSSVVRAAARLFSHLQVLPSILLIDPPPSRWPNMRRRSGPVRLDPGMLARIRALLAKAESTEFEAEAETFTAKAQELMTRHRIDRAILDREGSVEVETTARRISIDSPYAQAKAMLAGGIARANSCRTAWSKGLGFVTVHGHAEDLDGVEELYTSLLLQATTALQREGSKRDRFGRSRTAQFRRAFLLGFASRITERLCSATDETVQGAARETGRDLVRILDGRERAAEEGLRSAHGRLRTSRVSVSDGEGYEAGTRLADRADVSGPPALLNRRRSGQDGNG